jgi:hypothetical protein
VPIEPPLAHLLGVPLEELLPGMVGVGAATVYLRFLVNSWRR